MRFVLMGRIFLKTVIRLLCDQFRTFVFICRLDEAGKDIVVEYNSIVQVKFKSLLVAV